MARNNLVVPGPIAGAAAAAVALGAVATGHVQQAKEVLGTPFGFNLPGLDKLKAGYARYKKLLDARESVSDHLATMPENRGATVNLKTQALMRAFVDNHFPQHAKMGEIPFDGLSEAVLDSKDPTMDRDYLQLVDQINAAIDGRQSAPAASAKTVLTPADLKHPHALGNLDPSKVAIRLDGTKPRTIGLDSHRQKIGLAAAMHTIPSPSR